VFGLFAERLYTEASLATVAERLAVELAGTVFLTRVAAGA
jgi:hypothetical protein